jgi:hypothetical protein
MSNQETEVDFVTQSPKGVKGVFEGWMKFIRGFFEGN